MLSEYSFEGKVWKNQGAGGWHFVSLPNNLSSKIRRFYKDSEEGWGRLKVRATVNLSEWNTAIWFDTKNNTYLLPVKSLIRKKEKIDIDSKVIVNLLIL